MDRAVAAARAAFDSGPWPRMTAKVRDRAGERISDHTAANAHNHCNLCSLMRLVLGILSQSSSHGLCSSACLCLPCATCLLPPAGPRAHPVQSGGPHRETLRRARAARDAGQRKAPGGRPSRSGGLQVLSLFGMHPYNAFTHGVLNQESLPCYKSITSNTMTLPRVSYLNLMVFLSLPPHHIADVPLTVDHLRYFAGWVRRQRSMA